MARLSTAHRLRIANASVLLQDSGDVYSVMIASRLSAAATIKTIVNSVAHMVDAPRFPDTDLKAGHQL